MVGRVIVDDSNVCNVAPTNYIRHVEDCRITSSFALHTHNFASPRIRTPRGNTVIKRNVLSFANGLSRRGESSIVRTFLFTALITGGTFPHRSRNGR